MARVRAEVHAHDEDTDDKSRGEEAAAVLERGEGEGAPPGSGKLEPVAPCVRGAGGAPPPPDWPAGRPASSRPRSRPCSARSRRSRASSLRGQVASSSSWQADAWSASRSDSTVSRSGGSSPSWKAPRAEPAAERSHLRRNAGRRRSEGVRQLGGDRAQCLRARSAQRASVRVLLAAMRSRPHPVLGPERVCDVDKATRVRAVPRAARHRRGPVRARVRGSRACARLGGNRPRWRSAATAMGTGADDALDSAD